MKRIVLILTSLAILVLGIGFYQGWFVLTSGGRIGSDKVDVNLAVDPDKVQSDAEQVFPE